MISLAAAVPMVSTGLAFVTKDPPTTFSQRLWSGLNSSFFLAILGAVVLAALTNWYAVRQAADSDRQTRRAELAKLIVELDLRVARLNIALNQVVAAHRSAAILNTTGKRAIAIVDGNPLTVTSNPEFRNEHLVSLLSRAEFAAGVPLSDKSDFVAFSDLPQCTAARQLKFVYDRVQPLVHSLETHFADGSLPATGSGQDIYEAAVYADVEKLAEKEAKPYNILGKTSGEASLAC